MRWSLAIVVSVSIVSMATLSCTRRDESSKVVPVDEKRAIVDAAIDDAPLPRVVTIADVAAFEGKRVAVEGWYEVEPLVDARGVQRVSVVLVDGTRITRAETPIAKELPLANKKVVAIGPLSKESPDSGARVLGPRIVAERVDLAPNEVAAKNPKSVVPIPPLALTAPELASALDRWVHVAGTLDAVVPLTAAPTFADARVRLADGGVVRIDRVTTALWRPHLGHPVTVLGHLQVGSGAATFGLDLVMRGVTAICSGRSVPCGMLAPVFE